MWYRCTSPKHPHFKDYGGRGIEVCERWKSFALFLQDVGQRPPGKTLDRLDCHGNYEPGNCRWATSEEQQRNLRTNRLLTFDGKTQCLTAWAKEAGIKKSTLRERLERGWSVEAALGITSVKMDTGVKAESVHDL
jgi:hypothetical protein